jgi:hypothetical protein
MSDGIRSRAESASKAVATFVAALTLIVGVFEYYATYKHQRQAEQTVAVRDSQKPFLDRQFSLYFDAVDTTATIATSKLGSPDRERAEVHFWRLYWGQLASVENGDVEGAMYEFGNALDANKPNKELQQAALEVACSTRKSLADEWGIASGALQSRSCHW